ncbi:S-adenosylmethionine transporter [Rhizoctonia solani AG-1 IA]|uniref:S-adenosylmethionine transporter n=1 Tax=Thanatephorus cucumeris (strain AG1-IA) TaxID=983506 RepID=L8WS45_THACA|nr:S-adenosylmethionine transporter [Rhizoctonia solani AG-1 IA]
MHVTRSSPFTSNRMATQPTVHPTFTQAGGLAGTSVDLLFFPIDTIKTRLQSSQGFIKAGGLGGIYRGVGSVVIGSAPGAAIFFTTYSTLKQNLPIDTTHPLNHVVAASISEVAACLVRVPTEVVKSRTQTSAYGAGVSSFGAFLKVAQSESLGGLYRGFGSTVMREIKLGKTLDRPIDPHEAALCGSLAGAIAASATTPLDVLKTRIMLDVKVRPLGCSRKEIIPYVKIDPNISGRRFESTVCRSGASYALDFSGRRRIFGSMGVGGEGSTK